mgnify:CR=1 FL=1
MPALLAELFGRLLWMTEYQWLVFAGAMLATGISVVGVLSFGCWVIQKSDYRERAR